MVSADAGAAQPVTDTPTANTTATNAALHLLFIEPTSSSPFKSSLLILMLERLVLSPARLRSRSSLFDRTPRRASYRRSSAQTVFASAAPAFHPTVLPDP
jgi:hypothetical protein